MLVINWCATSGGVTNVPITKKTKYKILRNLLITKKLVLNKFKKSQKKINS